MTPDWATKPIDVSYADFGNPQSLNLHSYVKNNPTTTRDEDGHCPDGICQNIATMSPDQVNQQGQAFSDAVVGAAKGLQAITLINLVVSGPASHVAPFPTLPLDIPDRGCSIFPSMRIHPPSSLTLPLHIPNIAA
jgi:hypothetical protein